MPKSHSSKQRPGNKTAKLHIPLGFYFTKRCNNIEVISTILPVPYIARKGFDGFNITCGELRGISLLRLEVTDSLCLNTSDY